ncbi:hypothetical protein BFC18_09505 [Alteromonas confluentis]|uniref:Uncharacterized protein n=2 Tax=Alteromonas confluentis TaxID=1656094 RepID=A0A1E7ZCY4_9ALTE|nr:hypothetical protein BFC18_09505 [Alteromonas confluentis]
MENKLESNLKEVNSILLSALSRYCDSKRLLIKSIEDAYDRMLVAELYDSSVLTIKLISELEAEYEIFHPQTQKRTMEVAGV